MTSRTIEILPSGIPFVDKNWGGFYSGGTYIIHGPQKTGKTSLGLQFALHAQKERKSCVYFTNMRPRNVIIQAESIGLDIQSKIRSSQLVIIAIPTQREIIQKPNLDEFLSSFLLDIINVIKEFQPTQMVFDELTNFLQYSNLNLLSDVFSAVMEELERFHVTSLYVLRDPELPKNKIIQDMLIRQASGHIQLQRVSAEDELESKGENKITLIPNIGHNEGVFSSKFSIFKPQSPSGRRPAVIRDMREFIPTMKQMASAIKTSDDAFQLFAFYSKVENGEFNKAKIRNVLRDSVKIAASGEDLVGMDDNTLYVLTKRTNSDSLSGILGISNIARELLENVNVHMIPITAGNNNVDKILQNVKDHFQSKSENIAEPFIQ